MKPNKFIKPTTKGQIRKNHWIYKFVFKDEPNKFTFLDNDGWIIKPPEKEQVELENHEKLEKKYSIPETPSIAHSNKSNNMNSNDQNSSNQLTSSFLEASFNDIAYSISDNDDILCSDEFSNFEFSCI